jgi:4-amino-4-deoxy-L-arabinose transferase-like glycosyltransferase
LTHPRVQFWFLALAAVFLLVAPIRLGDLAGYDDAVYAHIAKRIVQSGDWLHLESNGFPALEHPPGFVWMQAALFSLFGFSDFLAKLPSALCGVGTVVLVYWLGRRLFDEQRALVAMLVMLATPYFIKYTAHGMTDVPFTFLFLAAVCAWVKAADDARWYAAVAILTAFALLTRGVVGFAVPLTLALDGWFRPRPARAFVAIAASLVPIMLWYWNQQAAFGDFFWEVQSNFLRDKLAGTSSGAGRYTGAIEYAWMLAQSYWPWLPFLVMGLSTRWKTAGILTIWCAVMFAACSLSGSRVLRYLLPAYPTFSLFAALGLGRWPLPMQWLAPAALLIAAGIAAFPPMSLHAAEVRPIAAAVQEALPEKQRFAFYDQAQARFDETAQLQWYGERTMWILTTPQAFQNALAEPISKVWVIDAMTFDTAFASRGATIVARSGHLLCVRLP